MNGIVVGLTGGIGSGKTAVAECFAGLGAAVVDTDAIAHELTGPGGTAMLALETAFGRSVVAADGRLDREAMRRQAFSDPEARKRLETILHPMIRARADSRCEEAVAAGAPYVVLVVPLLVESGDAYRRRVDRVVVVDCDDEVRIGRVIARSGLSRDDVARIMAAQASREARLAAADDVIDNNGSRDDLAAQVAVLDHKYRADFARKSVKG
ncbi:MAG: dephospho-CoA kinase [Gammaproteobacteria bacterium]|nr:dephospho-CoA kinase [Gammaproteobacteria bacterium]MBU1416365.1 dephospho-CoA kinase [Gammaproteobacteria bacterium]